MLPDDPDFPAVGDASPGYSFESASPVEPPSPDDWVSDVGLYYNLSGIDWPSLLNTPPFFGDYDYAAGSDDLDFAPSAEAIAVGTELHAFPFDSVTHYSDLQVRASILRLDQEVADPSPPDGNFGERTNSSNVEPE